MSVRIEGTVYKDDGCHLYSSCLSCPRELCIYDEQSDEMQSERSQRIQKEREAQITAMLRENASWSEIAAKLGISERSLFRVRHRMDADWRAAISQPQFRKAAFKRYCTHADPA